MQISQCKHSSKRLKFTLSIFVSTFRGVSGDITGVSCVPTASLSWWRSCLTVFRFSAIFGLDHGCPTFGIFWLGHYLFLWVCCAWLTSVLYASNSHIPDVWLLRHVTVFPCLFAQIVQRSRISMACPYDLKDVWLALLQMFVLSISLNVCVIVFFVHVCFTEKWDTTCTSFLWTYINVLFWS